jgi:FkbM family methyltransferase
LDKSKKTTIKIFSKYLNRKIYIRCNNSSDRAVFDEIIVFKEYDIDLKFSPQIIIDAGANCGISTLFFSKKYPESKIIAIEPDAGNIKMLELNCRNEKNITICPSALHSKECKMKAVNPNTQRQWAFQFIEDNKSEYAEITAITIPKLMDMLETDFIDILKIDIEGSEKELFNDLSSIWINKINAIIIETHDYLKNGCAEAFIKQISKVSGFTLFHKGESLVFVRDRIIR